MARSLFNPNIQIGASTAYAPTLAAGAAQQTGALTIQDDLNALRGQVLRILDATQSGAWYDDIAVTANGKKRSVKQLNMGLDTIENKPVLDTVSVTTTVAVPAGQNYVVLKVASLQTPTQTAAVNLDTLGAVVAQSAYTAAAFEASELAQIPGSDAASPKNRATIIDATTKNVVETSTDDDIFGLLQLESTGADGAGFNDTSGGARLKISFVYFNGTSNSLVACTPADIGGKSIRYTYSTRYSFGNLPEDAFIRSGYVDQVAAVDVTLTRATANQAGAAIPANADVLWRVANNANFKVQNTTGSKDLFAVSPTVNGNAVVVNSDQFSISTTSPVTSTKGLSLGTAAQAINVGVSSAQIDTTGPLAIKTLGSNGLSLSGGSTIQFADGYAAASNWMTGGPLLSGGTTEWNTYRMAYGEASLFGAIIKAGQMGSHGIKTANVTATTIAAGAIITGNGSGANISQTLGDYSQTPNLNSNVKIYLNGALLSPGSSSSTTEDYYLVGDATKGEFAFTFPVRGGAQPDKIRMEIFQSAANNG